MDRVEFAGLCGMYGWTETKGRPYRITLKHENGVTIAITFAKLRHMSYEECLKLLRESSKSAEEIRKKGATE